MRARVLVALLSALVLVSPTRSAEPAPPGEARLLRFPTTHGKHIVFCYGGDLYTVSSPGGVARATRVNCSRRWASFSAACFCSVMSMQEPM